MPDQNLVDVSPAAAEVGYGFNILRAPVFLTHGLWDICVQWDEQDTLAQDFQEQDARLWDVLFVCGMAIESDPQSFLNTMTKRFSILVIPRDGKSKTSVRANLVATGNIERGILVINLVDLDAELAEQG